MIGKLKGVIDSYGEDFVIVDVHGVGYLVHCSARTLQHLPPQGEAVSLSIETHVREDQIRLFGFASDLEREWFRLLQTVQGVGTKVALAILSVLLSDDKALAPHEEFYHRLLTPGATEASNFALSWLKASSRTALYDSVFVPALATVESDLNNGQLDKEQHAGVVQELRDVIEDLGSRPAPPSKLEADKAIASSDAGAPPAPPAHRTPPE